MAIQDHFTMDAMNSTKPISLADPNESFQSQKAPILLITMLVLLSSSYYIYKDYTAFVNLGPGGTPCNFLGYLRVSFLRLFALRNPCVPAPIPEALRPQTGYLLAMPKRGGQRPSVTGIAPHRQTTRKGSKYDFSALSDAIHALADRHPNRLKLGTSCFEKHGTGIFAVSPINGTCNGEICHAHPSDGSLHMTLHLADAKVVLENGWGERHPLAKGGWCERFVPTGFVMIYVPRDEFELQVVMEMIHAASWWVSGQVLEQGNDGENCARVADHPASDHVQKGQCVTCGVAKMVKGS
ncbi:MAG: hypothetical protein M1827_006599 [Pycnora praestabilis]|nr:MAG: hypothetical protein M1827_006599 [Pycnora praestabilis]